MARGGLDDTASTSRDSNSCSSDSNYIKQHLRDKDRTTLKPSNIINEKIGNVKAIEVYTRNNDSPNKMASIRTRFIQEVKYTDRRGKNNSENGEENDNADVNPQSDDDWQVCYELYVSKDESEEVHDSINTVKDQHGHYIKNDRCSNKTYIKQELKDKDGTKLKASNRNDKTGNVKAMKVYTKRNESPNKRAIIRPSVIQEVKNTDRRGKNNSEKDKKNDNADVNPQCDDWQVCYEFSVSKDESGEVHDSINTVRDHQNGTCLENYRCSNKTFASPTMASSANPEQKMLADHYLKIYDVVKSTGQFNYLSAKIPLPTPLKIQNWRILLQNYSDKEITNFLEFGWPIGFIASVWAESNHKNHPSAIVYPEQVEGYLKTEMFHQAMLGPFSHSPFKEGTHVSPLLTRPKRNSEKRRIILDLSWPKGASVNSYIPPDSYLGKQYKLTYPNIDDLCHLIQKYGEGCILYVIDLERAYRQLRSDPLCWPLLGIIWNKNLFIDVSIPFGLRTGAMMCQQQQWQSSTSWLKNQYKFSHILTIW